MSLLDGPLPPPVKIETHGESIGYPVTVEQARDVAGRELRRWTFHYQPSHQNVYVNAGIFYAMLEAFDLFDRLPNVATMSEALPKIDDTISTREGSVPVWLKSTVVAFLNELLAKWKPHDSAI